MAKKDNLREDGMLQDGTNPEGVDPVPPLNWSSKDDLKDVVVYGIRASPAVAKVLCFLKFYGIPYTFKPGFGKKSSKFYKKIPVVDVGGRQVNDAFIIQKNMVPAVSNGQLDEEWEKRITYEYQASLGVQLSNAEIAKSFKAKGSDSPIPGCLVGCVLGRIRPKGIKATKERSEDPNDPTKIIDLTEFAKEFFAAMQGQPYFHGAEPGPVDISFYGVNCRGVAFKLDTILNVIEAAGLMTWFKLMEEKVPLLGKPGALFEKL